MDRLIALVLLRWRMDLRSILGARERAVGLLFLAPSLALGSLVASVFVFVGIRALDRSHPELVLPGLSVAATVVGIFWVLSPLLAGVAFSETHDVSIRAPARARPRRRRPRLRSRPSLPLR